MTTQRAIGIKEAKSDYILVAMMTLSLKRL